MLEDLTQTYENGVKKGIWIPTQFNDYGTPVILYARLYSQASRRSKIGCVVHGQCTIGHTIPCPDDLISKLVEGYYFTKIDPSNAYSQIKLAPESQKRLTLSTHRGVLLQTQLSFGMTSVPGYFQEIMEKLTVTSREWQFTLMTFLSVAKVRRIISKT